MSSCAASCCICFPKASSAFATLVSLPTAGAPPSCRFAFNYSEQYSHRTPNQKPLLPRNRAHFGSVPNAAAAWWSSRDSPLPRSNSVLHPLSPSRPMKQPFPARSLGAPHHPQAWCALLAPKPAVRSQPRPKIPFPPHANSPKPILASLLTAPVAVPQASLLTPT